MGVKGNSEQGAKSRRKGVAFERTTANQFSDAFAIGCRRTPSSGAYGAEWKMSGDLMFSERFDWYVELKKQESWHTAHLFSWPTGPIPKWWDKAKKEAAFSEQYPLLIVARNHVPPLMIMQWSAWDHIGELGGYEQQDWNQNALRSGHRPAHLVLGGMVSEPQIADEKLIVFRMDYILDNRKICTAMQEVRIQRTTNEVRF